MAYSESPAASNRYLPTAIPPMAVPWPAELVERPQ